MGSAERKGAGDGHRFASLGHRTPLRAAPLRAVRQQTADQARLRALRIDSSFTWAGLAC